MNAQNNGLLWANHAQFSDGRPASGLIGPADAQAGRADSAACSFDFSASREPQTVRIEFAEARQISYFILYESFGPGPKEVRLFDEENHFVPPAYRLNTNFTGNDVFKLSLIKAASDLSRAKIKAAEITVRRPIYSALAQIDAAALYSRPAESAAENFFCRLDSVVKTGNTYRFYFRADFFDPPQNLGPVHAELKDLASGNKLELSELENREQRGNSVRFYGILSQKPEAEKYLFHVFFDEKKPLNQPEFRPKNRQNELISVSLKLLKFNTKEDNDTQSETVESREILLEARLSAAPSEKILVPAFLRSLKTGKIYPCKPFLFYAGNRLQNIELHPQIALPAGDSLRVEIESSELSLSESPELIFRRMIRLGKVGFNSIDDFADPFEATQEIGKLADLLLLKPRLKVVLHGHTATADNETMLRELSLKRIEKVRNVLISKGINPERIRTEAHGSSRPLADNTTAEGRASNRRVEAEIIFPDN